jgi:hypothetical protein
MMGDSVRKSQSWKGRGDDAHWAGSHRRVLGMLLVMVVGAGTNPIAGGADRPAAGKGAGLAEALTFHASFDQGTDADTALGDRRIYTAKSYRERSDARPGLHQPAVQIADGAGKFGSALQFRDKNTTAIYYQARQNVAYRERDWSGTVSFWLSLDPDKDLAPGYCDPIQVTDADYNDAALWVDFSKDERPRHFRLGVFGDLAVWNPEKRDPDKNPDFQQRLVPVTKPSFGQGKWTQIVITFAGLNRDEPGEARLYLDGQLQGKTGPIREPFTWDLSRAAIRLGLNYTGLFDDLAVFDRALSAEEVQTLYRLDGGVASLKR